MSGLRVRVAGNPPQTHNQPPMRGLLTTLFILTLLAPATAQPGTFPGQPFGGYLTQTAITQESYLITNAHELNSFIEFLPKVTPYKNLPATPNPDRFLNGYSPDFEESILVLATGRDRITDPPVFQGVETAEDGTRVVKFYLPDRSTQTHPYGWAVYTGVVLPRFSGATRVLVTTPEGDKDEGFKRADFKRADFPRL